MRIRRSTGMAVLLFVAEVARAQVPPAPPTAAEMSDFESICAIESTGIYFPALRDEAVAVRNRLCEEHAGTDVIFDSLADFIDRARLQRLFGGFGGFVNTQPGAALQDPIDAAWSNIRFGAEPEVPPLAETLVDLEIEVNGEVFRVADVNRCEAEARSRAAASPSAGDGSCLDAVGELIDVYNIAQSALASPLALAFANAARAIDADWQTYLDEMRGQTLLELAINTKLYRRKHEGAMAGFTPAPDRQWIVLHPGLVVENVGDAVDGENTKEALMLELVGMNWWRNRVNDDGRERGRFAPSGFSIISVYSDRPGVTDAGYGLALHFDSVYTLGFTSHDGDNGVFVSFDLLKLLQDKQKALEEYRQ